MGCGRYGKKHGMVRVTVDYKYKGSGREGV